jgi:hypothetical protein
MQTDCEKAMRTRGAIKFAVGLTLMLVAQLSGLVSGTESYFEGRKDIFPFEQIHLMVLSIFLLPWLCFFIGVLELVTGMPFRAILWDWDHSRRARSATIAITLVLVLVGLLLLVVQYVFHFSVL